MSWKETNDPEWSIDVEEMLAVDNTNGKLYRVRWSTEWSSVAIEQQIFHKDGSIQRGPSAFLKEEHPIVSAYLNHINQQIVGDG